MTTADALGVERLAARVAELEQQVADLRERERIAECLHRYSRGLDRHDEELLRSVFHADAKLRYGPNRFPGGPDDFVAWANDFHEESWVAHVHMVAVNRIDLEGDVAHTESYVWFSLSRNGRETVDVGCGRYIDRLEKRDGDWRIVVREMLLEWQGTVVGTEVPDHAGGVWDRTDPSYRRPLDIDFTSDRA